MAHIHSLKLRDVAVPRSTFYGGVFGRLFGKLPPWQPKGATETERIDTIRQFAETRMFRPAGADDPIDNPNVPAGYTYFGQFIDHDVTFDPTSSLERANDPNRIRNFRTPRLDLDSVYGGGPHDQPYLYDTSRTHTSGFSGYFLIGSGDNPNEPDLPRNELSRALIGDMRNDENLIVAQIQLAFLRLHNRVLEAIVGSPDPADEEQFTEAQRIVRWFYQYVVWNDFIARIVEPEVHERVLAPENGLYCFQPRVYGWKESPFLPVEFAVAAYRFGHSMVRPGYQINTTPDHDGVTHPIFGRPGSGAFDLRGFRKLPSNSTVQWNLFLDFSTSPRGFPQASQQIDSLLSRSVFHIPAGPNGTNPLAFLNILRGWRFELPKGTDVARASGRKPIEIDECTPEDSLWVYLLKEAEATGGRHLGYLGSDIVAETFAGLLYGDPLSFVRYDPTWTPAREAALPFDSPIDKKHWQLADLILASGAPISDRDVEALVDG
jgi:hypothetical protein